MQVMRVTAFAIAAIQQAKTTLRINFI